MKLKNAITVLKKECTLLGLSMKELLLFIDLNPYAFSNNSVRAAKIYKKENA